MTIPVNRNTWKYLELIHKTMNGGFTRNNKCNIAKHRQRRGSYFFKKLAQISYHSSAQLLK